MRARLTDTALTLFTIIIASAAVWLGSSRKLPAAIDSILFPPPPAAAQLAAPLGRVRETSRILALPALDFGLSRKTLLVIVRSDCRFCTASKSFYAELLKRELSASHSVRVFLVGPVEDNGFSRYLTDLPFASNRRVQVPTASLGVTGTPTLLLVDQSGRVADTWIGKLASVEEANVLSVTFPTDE